MSSSQPRTNEDNQATHDRKPPDPGPWQQDLLAHAPSLRGLIEPLTAATTQDLTVLLTGETGTGKTHLARLIHANSRRRDHRLLVIPCGALSPGLLAGELFGHLRGAFTGADRNQPGKLAAVGAGTLLLDEVDTLSVEQQAKLLRVLETGEYEPVGGTRTHHCGARILAASNVSLEEAIARGTFRQDLYYRLSVLTIHLPPLRGRPADIGPLARGLVAQSARRFGKGPLLLSAAALAALEGFAWPGNVRQLQNVLQRAVLACTGPTLLPRHLALPAREVSPAAADLPTTVREAPWAGAARSGADR
jgi:transcriptional regulator with PAS, ATPase and Fis domain